MDVFKILGIIAVSNDDAIEAIKETTETAEDSHVRMSSAFSKIGNAAVQVGKFIATGLAVGATAIAGITAKAMDSYADYEQLVGGVETLYGASIASAEEYAEKHGISLELAEKRWERYQEREKEILADAAEAYKTAGMSANEYMETVNGFAASLVSSLGEYEHHAASTANMIVTDMADNANKMGTSIESIQNAYSGFAKQNYTMLDNLKLGYGGTKEEMERLLADAAEIAGVEMFDINSFADVAEAIHIIQEEMGITGTTAREASATISGSISSMKSAFANLLTGIADENQDVGALLETLVNSAMTVGDNIIPRVQVILEGIGEAIQKVVPKIVTIIPQLLKNVLPGLLGAASTLITALIGAITSSLPTLLEAFISAFSTVFESLVDMLPEIISSIELIFNEIVAALPSLMEILISSLPILIPMLVESLVSMMLTLMEYLPDIIQPIIDYLPDIIIATVDVLMLNLPILIEGMTQLVVALVQSLPEIFMSLYNAMPTVMSSIVNGLKAAFPVLVAGLQQIANEIWIILEPILMPIINGIAEFFSGLWVRIKEIFTPVVEWVQEKFNQVTEVFHMVVDPWIEIFSIIFTNIKEGFAEAVENIKTAFAPVAQFFDGIWTGIKDTFSHVATWFRDTFSEAWNNVKDVFSSGGAIFDGIKEGIAGVFTTVVNGLIGGINKVIKVPFDAINDALSAIKGIEIVGVKPFDWITTFTVPELPMLESGGVLEKGQMGLLEGNGAEAVVPLEKNREWIANVSEDMQAQGIGGGGKETLSVLQEMLAVLHDLKEDSGNLPEVLVDAIANGLVFNINNREFARLVKAV